MSREELEIFEAETQKFYAYEAELRQKLMDAISNELDSYQNNRAFFYFDEDVEDVEDDEIETHIPLLNYFDKYLESSPIRPYELRKKSDGSVWIECAFQGGREISVPLIGTFNVKVTISDYYEFLLLLNNKTLKQNNNTMSN